MSKSVRLSKISGVPNPFEMPKDSDIYAFRDRQAEILKKVPTQLSTGITHPRLRKEKS